MNLHAIHSSHSIDDPIKEKGEDHHPIKTAVSFFLRRREILNHKLFLFIHFLILPSIMIQGIEYSPSSSLDLSDLGPPPRMPSMVCLGADLEERCESMEVVVLVGDPCK